MQAASWKNITVSRNHLYSSPQFADFHSTPITLAKWKSKWDYKGERNGQKPSKTYIRYAVRQKRAEAKKALKDYLLYGKSSDLHFQDENVNCPSDSHGSDNIPRFRSYGKSRLHDSSHSGKGKNSGSKYWQKRQCFYDFYNENEFVHPEMIFEAVFSRHRGYTWSYTSAGNFHFNNSTSGFRWTDESRWEKARKRFWHENDDDESTNVGSHAHRAALGLPLTGQLNLDDVKCAFRASALKWHPDKHQGSSQAMAEEKFKLCVNAYNSLCSDLRST
ncbi:uncharacterized protein [Typha latifolia]|uniref:uncharacterized protein isoform X1 n=1 Tax=Typha latifolia TaxID=4733 RepID=UPI003C2C7A9A